MRNLRKETGSSIATIILLLIIVIILGALFYLRSNDMIHLQGTPWASTQKEQENTKKEKDPYLDVKGAVDNLQNSSNR